MDLLLDLQGRPLCEAKLSVAFAFHEADIRAVAAPPPSNVSATHVHRVLNLAIPVLRQLRPTLAVETPRLDFVWIDRLPSLQFALRWASNLAYPGKDGDKRAARRALFDEGVALRKKMLLARRSLGHAGVLRGEFLRPLSGRGGYQSLAGDLPKLGCLFLDNPEVFSKSPVTRADAERAMSLAQQLTGVDRRPRDITRAAYADDREVARQAMALTSYAYNEARAGVLLVERALPVPGARVPALLDRRLSARRSVEAHAGAAGRKTEGKRARSEKRTRDEAQLEAVVGPIQLADSDFAASGDV